jgi:RNA polymerase sigma factor (sigma-70 family)
MPVADVRSLLAAAQERVAPCDPASDRDLLRRFAAARDEAAFAEIVRRHRPMLLRLCQRVLHSGHDAEDVCQAAFLLLAQQATSPRWHASVAGWLFQTAYRLSLKARTAASRRRRHETQAKPATAPDPVAELTVGELQAVLDDELSRLPEKWRAPILLCLLEGRSRDEAAHYLGWTLAAIKNCLEQGRERLRSRLARRGLLLGTAILSAWLLDTRGLAACTTAAPLAAAKDALAVASGQAGLKDVLPPHVAALAKGGTPTMFARAASIVVLVGLALGLGTVAVVTIIWGAAPTTEAPVPQAAAQPAGQVPQPAAPQKEKEALLPAQLLLDGHRGAVHALALDRDGKTLVTAGADKTVRIWDLATGHQLHRLEQPAEVAGVALSRDGKKLAVVCTGQGGALLLWDADKGTILWRSLPPGVKDIAGGAVAFSPDGTLLAAQFGAGVTCMFDVPSGRVLSALRLEAGKAQEALAFSSEGGLVAVADGSGSVHLVDAPTGKLLAKWAGQRPVQALTFLAGGAKVAAADGGRTVRVLDVASGKEDTAFEVPDTIDALAATPDGKWVATAAAAGMIRVWDLAAGKTERQFQPMGPVRVLVLGPQAKLLATAGAEGAVVWDLTRDEKPLPKNLQLSAKDLEGLWADLESGDAGKAYAAARLLRADPARSVPFLHSHLKPKVDVPSAEKLKQLIADLDAVEFKKRETANRELEKLGVLAESALKAALAAGPTLEMRQRLERLLKLLGSDGKPLMAAQQREIRAVRVLEWTAAPEARQLLEMLATQAPGWWVRQEARAALKRMAQASKKT